MSRAVLNPWPHVQANAARSATTHHADPAARAWIGVEGHGGHLRHSTHDVRRLEEIRAVEVANYLLEVRARGLGNEEQVNAMQHEAKSNRGNATRTMRRVSAGTVWHQASHHASTFML